MEERRKLERAIFPCSPVLKQIFFDHYFSRYVRLKGRKEEGEETEEARSNFPFFSIPFQRNYYLKMQARSQGVSVATLGAPQWQMPPPLFPNHY